MKHFVSACVAVLIATNALAGDTYPFAGGPIVRLNADAKQITIQTGEALRNFVVTNQSHLINRSERITFDKLKIGTPVKLNYYTNETGKAVIRRLKITYPPTDDIPDKTQ
ncbi:MAG: hypothetical protein PCFJNLEI_00826 [Verrucomicrobiae bacterium]|nr:hypothetical protein [Verrucomicrobiae bacterium]